MARKKRMRHASASNKVVASSGKIHLALKNLVLFAVIFGLSLGVYNTVRSPFWVNTFWIASLITGFIALAFLLVWLVLVFMRLFRK